MRIVLLSMVMAGLLDPSVALGQTGRATRVDPLTASIAGTVTTADTGAPVGGAEVRISSANSYRRLVTTDGDGHFDIRDLPSGEYRLTASRAGFTSIQYGQRQPFEAPTVIRVSRGERFIASVALRRGGVIYGHVFDHFGEPLAGVRIQVLRSRMVQGQRRLQGMGLGDQSDDTGAFRLFGLPPGDYYVTASKGEPGAVNREPPVFYPGTPSFTEAIPIRLAPGSEVGADFQIPLVHNARVSGIVLNSAGAPMVAMVHLASEAVGTGPAPESSAPPAFMINGDSGPDGRFTIDNVPPGPYTLSATSAVDAGAMAAFASTPNGRRFGVDARKAAARLPETAAMHIAVADGDVSDLTLVTSRAGRLTVSFVAGTGVVSPLPSNLRVNTRGTSTGGVQFFGGSGSGRREQTIPVTAGSFYLEVQGLPEQWFVSSVMVDGVDVTDQPIDIHGQEATARVVLSDRSSEISGVVQSREAIASYTVVIFPDDPSRWTYPSRYVRTAKTDDQGRFSVAGLPPDERYLVAAVDYLEEGEEQDPDVLEQLRARTTSVSLGDGEQRAIWLDLVKR